MRAKHAVGTLLFSVAALALSACSDQRQEPAPKTAEINEVRSVDDAKSRFLKMVDWQSRPSARATLYNDLLDSRDAVGEIGFDVVHRASEFEWFALIDYEPGAYFRHPVSYAFLTYSDPKVSLISRNHFPTINYAPVWPTVRDLLSDSNVLYSETWIDLDPQRSGEDILAQLPEHWPPRMSTDQCKNEKRAYAVLIHNLENLDTSPETVENLEMMAAALTANGYYVQDFVQDGGGAERMPYINLAAPKGNGIYQLMTFINVHVDFNDCCEEIVVYVTGETSVEKSDRQDLVTLDLPFAYSGVNGDRKAARSFHSEDLASILDRLKTCHLNVVIDTNSAAGLADDLLRVPTTESVLASCQKDEYTYSSAVETLARGAFKDPYGIDLGERGSEFTSSVAKAIFDFSKTRASDDVPPPAVSLINASFEAVKAYDLAYLAGKTTPSLRGRTLKSGCPCGIDEELTRY